jgi:radical SAM protein with 4Fe4S-binding SPASM domain
MSSKIPHYSENRTILADVIPLATPFTVQCEVSQLCNLKCNYCIQPSLKGKHKELMKFETFSLLCRQISLFRNKLRQFNFAGWGEPLINPRLPRMVEFLKALGITENIAIVTNGLLLNPKLTRSLVAAGVDHFRISLQGMSSQRYLEVSKKKMDFEKLVGKIGYLYEHKGNAQVSVKLADAEMTREDEAEFYATFDGISDRAYVEYIQPVFGKGNGEHHVSKFGKSHDAIKVCPQPFYMLAVTALGDVLPCCSYFDPLALGNVHGELINKMWSRDKLKDFQKMMVNGWRMMQKNYPVCKGCNVPNVTITPEDELDGRMEEIRGRL